MKKTLLLVQLFLFHSIFSQVSKSDAVGQTLDASIATRNFVFTSGDFGGVTSLSEIEIDLTLTVTDNSGCNAGAFGVHSDIAVSLESPSGTVVHLVQDFTGILLGSPPVEITYQDVGFPNIVNQTATYDDDAALLADDQTFFGTGTWKPHNPLSAFDGENPIGTWILRVADGRSQGFPDFTCYIGATVRITPSVTCTGPTVPTVTHTPATVCTGGTASLNISGTLNDATAWQIYTGSCGGTNIGSTTTGTFAIPGVISSPTTYFVRGEGGCVTPGSCGSVTITPTALDDASFSYGASAYCVNAADPTPTITGLAGGTFSSTAGLSINASTGQIDVSASTPNTYTVTYTTSGTCPNSSNVLVTINALDDASFSYGASAYCVNAADPTPTITGLAGGTFSSTAGLSINASTGQIDVSASTPNTYTVTYTTSGSCPNSSNVSVTINALDDASFSYGASAYCVNAADPTPTITGLAGGTFSSTAGLSINASTGQIDVSTSTPNTYTVTYTTAGACPNSSGVSVTINQTTYDTIADTACASYLWVQNGVTYTLTGLYNDTITNAVGCDSVVTLDLTIANSYDTIVDTACDSYLWSQSGMTYTLTGLYNDTVTNAAGCDSVITLDLTINVTTYDTIVDTACDSYLWTQNGMTYTLTGLYNDTVTNAAGCDSVITLDLTINVTTYDTIVDTACDSYLWTQNGITYTLTGLYNDTVTNAAGCDSVITLDLTINVTTYDTIVDTACDSYLWTQNGMTYTLTGLYNDTVTNAAGCDSVITLDLTINVTTYDTIADTACDSYLWVQNGMTYTLTGLYNDTVTNAAGCDSVITLDVIIASPYNDTLTTDTICGGDSVLIFGNYESVAGWYVDSSVTFFGCDSVTHHQLVVLPNTVTVIYDSICYGDSLLIGSIYYSESGVYNDTVGNSSNGCYILEQHSLTVKTIYPAMLGEDISECQEATVTLYAGDYYDGYLWQDGSTDSTLVIDGNIYGEGSHVIMVTVTDDSTGCQDSDTLNITFNNCTDITEVDGQSLINIYPNPTNGLVTIDVSQLETTEGVRLDVFGVHGQLILSEQVVDTKQQIDLLSQPNGMYTVSIKTQNMQITRRLVIQH